MEVDEQKPNHLMVLVSSDRGLCGGVHSSLAKAAKAAIAEQPSSVNTMLIPCGDKARTILQKTHGGCLPGSLTATLISTVAKLL